MGLILLQIIMQVNFKVIRGHLGSLAPSSGEIKKAYSLFWRTDLIYPMSLILDGSKIALSR